MSFKSNNVANNKLAKYLEYYTNKKSREELESVVKRAVLEENWSFLHFQESFVEKMPDRAKEALLAMNKGGFNTAEVFRYLSDQVDAALIKEAEQITLPAYEPICCIVDGVPIIINFDWSHPTGQWVIHTTDEDKKNDFAKISHRMLRWVISRQADYIKKVTTADEEAGKPAFPTLTMDILKKPVDWIKIDFIDYAIFIADSRKNAIEKGANFLKEIKDCLQTDLFYYNRKNGQAKVTLPTDDYSKKLYSLAARMNIEEHADRIFSRI